MGLRVIRKIEAIIREEMNRAGAVELLMPVVQPAELWQESGRWTKMGPELLRVKDRHERDFVIQPTSEEVVTDIARQELRSYRAAAEESLPHPDQVPRRAPAALRHHARARVHDEGRLFLRPRRRGRRPQLRRDVRRLPAHLRAPRPRLPRRRRRHRAPSAATARTSSRSSPTPARTPSSTARRATTPPTSSWPRRSRRARRAPSRRSRWKRRPPPARAPAPTWPRCSACRSSAR